MFLRAIQGKENGETLMPTEPTTSIYVIEDTNSVPARLFHPKFYVDLVEANRFCAALNQDIGKVAAEIIKEGYPVPYYDVVEFKRPESVKQ